MLGRSENANQTQRGPSTISSNVISATSAAGINRTPIIRKTKPSTIWPAPSATIRSRSRVPACKGCENGRNTTSTRSCERQRAGAIEMSRRWRVMTRPRAKEREVSAERPRPRPCEPPGPPTIRPTPASATTMARAIRPETASCRAAQAINAAAMGETACMKSTFATVVWLRPTMKAADAVAHATATAIPVGPIEENARTTPPRSVNETYTSSASTAKNARPATCVAVPTEISRWRTPALDQASAARPPRSARGGGRRGRPSPPTRPRLQSSSSAR